MQATDMEGGLGEKLSLSSKKLIGAYNRGRRSLARNFRYHQNNQNLLTRGWVLRRNFYYRETCSYYSTLKELIAIVQIFKVNIELNQRELHEHFSLLSKRFYTKYGEGI